MTNHELGMQLRKRVFILGDSVLREDGIMLLNVNNVFMFRSDAVDLGSAQ